MHFYKKRKIQNYEAVKEISRKAEMNELTRFQLTLTVKTAG